MPTALSGEELDALIAHFDSLVTKSLRRAIRAGTTEALTAASNLEQFHLPGEHNQETHGHGHGGEPRSSPFSPLIDPESVKTRDQLEAISVGGRLPPDDKKWEHFYHATRSSSDVESIAKGGVQPSTTGGRVFLSKDEVRDRGGGFVIVRVPRGTAKEGTDRVESGLTYREFTVDNVPPTNVVRGIRSVKDSTGFTINEDKLAEFALQSPNAPEAADLPSSYQSWFTIASVTAAAKPLPEPGPPPAYEPPTTPVTPILPATVTLEDLVLIERAWRREVKNVILPELERTMRAAADRVLKDIATEAPVLWDVSQPQAQAFLAQTQNQLVGVGEDMWKRTRDELIAGMQEGESIQQLSTRVKEVLSTTDARARTIARTEVIGASNAGAMQQLELLGPDAPVRKTWVSTHDARTRLSHRAADGQTVDFVAPFTVGGAKFDYPGDPDAPASERVNCRCTLVWHFEDLPLKSMLKASSPLEMFTKAGDPYVRDAEGQLVARLS